MRRYCVCILLALSAALLGACGQESYITVGESVYGRDEVTDFAALFDYTDDIMTDKFAEFALLCEAAGDIEAGREDAASIYGELEKSSLRNLISSDARKYMEVIPQDSDYFDKEYVISYMIYLLDKKKADVKKDVRFVPGDLPEPADLYISQSAPGREIKGIETKYGFIDVQVQEVKAARTPLSGEKRLKIRKALAASMALEDIKYTHGFGVITDALESAGPHTRVLEVDGKRLKLKDVMGGPSLLPDSEDKYSIIKYNGEMLLLRLHYADKLKYLKKISPDLFRVRKYQEDYLKASWDGAERELSAGMMRLVYTDGTREYERILYPEESRNGNFVKGKTFTADGVSFRVIKAESYKPLQRDITEYLFRRMFRELVSQYRVEFHEK